MCSGLSGGVDSSFVAYYAKRELGLRPLVVHFDNGWDTEPAARNIEKIVQKLDLDLYTYRVDWEEFKDLQLSFLKASVIDIEMLTDHAIAAVLANVAREKRLKYILRGRNLVTEGLMAKSWIFPKWDTRNIKAIHAAFGREAIKTFPTYGLFKRTIMEQIRPLHYVDVLNYLHYNRQKAIEVLKREVGWERYGKNHYESVFTRFYQRYILPRKFGVDKRKVHLSALICSGQLTREEALKELRMPLYDDSKQLEQEKSYVLERLGLSDREFERIMNLPVKSYLDYPNNQWRYRQLLRITRPLRLARLIIRRVWA